MTCSLVIKGSKEEVAVAKQNVSKKLDAAAESNRVLKNITNGSIL